MTSRTCANCHTKNRSSLPSTDEHDRNAKELPFAALGTALWFGCTASPMPKYNLDVPAQTLSVVDAPEVRDGRARFREAFCSTLREHPDRKQRGCE